MKALSEQDELPADTRSDRAGRILKEQIGLLVQQSDSGFAAALVGGLLLGVPLLQWISPTAVGAWISALVLGYVTRQRLMRRAFLHGSLDRVRKVALVASALLGLVVTAPAPLFYASCPLEVRALLSMIQLVWMTAAITVLAVFPLSYKLYSAFSLTFIAAGWWLSSSPKDAALVTALMLPLWLLLSRFADRVGRLIEQSVDIRHEREALVDRLTTALSQLEEANASRSRFLAAASHDLLQPIHALLLLTGVTRDVREPRRLSQLHEQMHTVAGSIESMFRGLLDLARFEAGTLNPVSSPVSVPQLLKTILVEYEERCAAKGIELRMDCPSGLLVRCDPALSARVLRNLVDNAVKFTVAGSVELSARWEGSSVVITVRDTGVGIGEDDLGRVRVPFYRGHAARELEVAGVGLGLSTATQIAQVMDGSLSIASVAGAGTTVTVILPGAVGLQTAALPNRADEPPLRYRVVALVEDNRLARDAMKLWLLENGCEVAAAADPSSVIAECEARRIEPDFILADYTLGAAGTGVQAIASLRLRFGALPAAIVTGDPLESGQVPHGVPLLKKPLQPGALRQLLQGEPM